MQKKILTLGFIVALLVILSIQPILALENKISVDPGILSPGGEVEITLTLADKTTGGTLTVTHKPSGTSWSIDIPGGWAPGSKSWTFPKDWLSTNPGANTDGIGDYDITAIIGINSYTATFKVEFFVIPELLFGSITATIACFAAVVGFMKFRNHKKEK